MKRFIIALLIALAIVAVGFLMKSFSNLSQAEISFPASATAQSQSPAEFSRDEKSKVKSVEYELLGVPDVVANHSIEGQESAEESIEPFGVHFALDEEGLAIVDGDIVLGIPQGGEAQGIAAPPQIHLWPNGVIPFVINKDVPDIGRIIFALTYFVDSGVQFVAEKSGDEDVLVFAAAEKGCKSYLGKVGGRQPIWIGPGCSSSDIAHEIMHALGFLHEQNRSDRDAHVQVMQESITPGFEKNFEVFPSSMMTVSGAAPFDYESLMIYPPHTFSKDGRPTLVSMTREAIRPGNQPSVLDLQRIQKLYGKGQDN